MLIGKPSFWLRSIIDIDKEVMKCVKRVWPKVISRLAQTNKEDEISERLVDCLREDEKISQYGFITLHFKLKEQDSKGDFTTKGILDIALFLDQDYQKYIAYECKRLNILSKDGKRKASLAGPYCDEGIIRYVTAKYSEKLPYGCMLGYVMDGDIEFAFKQLAAAIEQRSDALELCAGNIAFARKEFPEFETAHFRVSDNSNITIRHRLLSMIL